MDGTIDNRVIAKSDDSITLKCVGVGEWIFPFCASLSKNWRVRRPREPSD